IADISLCIVVPVTATRKRDSLNTLSCSRQGKVVPHAYFTGENRFLLDFGPGPCIVAGTLRRRCFCSRGLWVWIRKPWYGHPCGKCNPLGASAGPLPFLTSNLGLPFATSAVLSRSIPATAQYANWPKSAQPPLAQIWLTFPPVACKTWAIPRFSPTTT